MTAFLTKSLGVVCPSCDFLNVVGAVRCMACGSPTDAAAKPASSGSAVQAPPGMKRATNPTPQPIPQTTVPASAMAQTIKQPPPAGTQPAPAPAAPPGPKFGLTVLAGPARGQRFRLGATGAQIGRSKGVILFPDDPFVSPLHATMGLKEGKLFVRDDGSASGVYASINGQETITNGALFATGMRLFRFVGSIEPAAQWNKKDVLVYGAPLPNNVVHYLIEEVLLGDRAGRGLITAGPVFTIGQAKCDFSYPNDEGLAQRHAEVAPMPTGAMIRDLSGGLGTYVRITGERPLKPGDRIRVGQQTLQVEQL